MMTGTRRRTITQQKRDDERALIVGGQEARRGKYPYFVLINDGCGGSLIAPDIVLTAGHCLPSRTILLRRNGDDYDSSDDGDGDHAVVDLVRVGIVARHPDVLLQDEDQEEELFAVLDATRHARYEQLGDDEFR